MYSDFKSETQKIKELNYTISKKDEQIEQLQMKLEKARRVAFENAKPLTLEEVVPKVIQDLRVLNREIKYGSLNRYQMGLVLSSIIKSLEQPGRHLSDGSVII